MTEAKHNLEKRGFEVDQLRGKVKGLEIKLVKKDENIEELEAEIAKLKDEVSNKKKDNEALHQRLNEKDCYFNGIRE